MAPKSAKAYKALGARGRSGPKSRTSDVIKVSRHFAFAFNSYNVVNSCLQCCPRLAALQKLAALTDC